MIEEKVPRYFGPLRPAVYHNRLHAYDLESGDLVWQVAGTDKPGEGNDGYFLGPPLPIHGSLYTLLQKNTELRLVALDPGTGKTLFAQSLGSVRDRRDRVLLDPSRRLHVVALAHGQGVLVVPTHAGSVLGFDLRSEERRVGEACRCEWRSKD